MKNLYLILTIIGFIAPNIWVAMVSVETGNILFWLKPMETMAGMFPNKIATAFMVDLLFVVLVFFVWSYHEAKKMEYENPMVGLGFDNALRYCWSPTLIPISTASKD